MDFKDESGSSLIEFLAREVLYTKVSFNSIEHLKSYFLKEDITRKTYLMYSPKYVYYNIPNSPLLGRTLKVPFPLLRPDSPTRPTSWTSLRETSRL